MIALRSTRAIGVLAALVVAISSTASAATCFEACSASNPCTDSTCNLCDILLGYCISNPNCNAVCGDNNDCTDGTSTSCATCDPGSNTCVSQCGNACNADAECTTSSCPYCVSQSCTYTTNVNPAICGQSCSATSCSAPCNTCSATTQTCVTGCGGRCNGPEDCDVTCGACTSGFCRPAPTTTTTTTTTAPTTTSTTTTTTEVPTTTTSTTTTTEVPTTTTSTTTTTAMPTTTTAVPNTTTTVAPNTTTTIAPNTTTTVAPNTTTTVAPNTTTTVAPNTTTTIAPNTTTTTIAPSTSAPHSTLVPSTSAPTPRPTNPTTPQPTHPLTTTMIPAAALSLEVKLVTAGAVCVAPLLVMLLAMLLVALCRCCATEERRMWCDVLCVDLTPGHLGILWLDARNGRILDQFHEDVPDDYFSDAVDLDHRLAAKMEELALGAPFDTVPRGVVMLVPDVPPDILASRLLSAAAKFNGIMFDRNLGACDGSLQNIQIVNHTVACCVGCVALHKDEMNVDTDEVQFHAFIDFRASRTVLTFFVVSWESGRSCYLRILHDVELSCGRLPLEEIQRNPYLTQYITTQFEPLMRQLQRLMESSCSARTRVYCALNGAGADSGAIQNYLTSMKRLSVWLPTKNFHECSLGEFGAAILAGSGHHPLPGQKTEGRLALQVRTSQSITPKFKSVLDLLAQRAQQMKSIPHSMVKAPSGNSLFSLHESQTSPPSNRGLDSAAFHRSATSPMMPPTAGKRPSNVASSGNSKRSFRSFIGSNPSTRHSLAKDKSSSDVSLSAMNDEDDERTERLREAEYETGSTVAPGSSSEQRFHVGEEGGHIQEQPQIANPADHDDGEFQEFY